jgi:hypothetical protein
MKIRGLAILALLCSLFVSSPVDAGPLRWIKEAGEFVFQRGAKREAEERAARLAAIEASQREVARRAMIAYAGNATKAFQVGAYTIAGGVIFNSVLAGYGYASSETPSTDEEVAREIATSAGNGDVVYRERYCIKPTNGERYVVPAWMTSCGDGSTPINGNGISLEAVRELARG